MMFFQGSEICLFEMNLSEHGGIFAGRVSGPALEQLEEKSRIDITDGSGYDSTYILRSLKKERSVASRFALLNVETTIRL